MAYQGTHNKITQSFRSAPHVYKAISCVKNNNITVTKKDKQLQNMNATKIVLIVSFHDNALRAERWPTQS